MVPFGLVGGSRSVLVFGRSSWRWFHLSQGWFAFGVGFSFAFGVCLRSASVRRGVCGGFVSPRCWLAFGVGCGPSRFALVSVVLRVRWFRIVFFFVRRRVLVDPGQNWTICVVN